MHKFKELTVWQKALDLSLDVYSLTRKLPKEERFGLTAQMNKCAVSIPSNIAEGAGRNTNGEFSHFLGISTGSCFELETQLIMSQRLNYLKADELVVVFQKVTEVQKMTYGLQNSLVKN